MVVPLPSQCPTRRLASFAKAAVARRKNASRVFILATISLFSVNFQRLALHRGKLLFEEHSPLAPGRRFGHIHFAFSVRRAQLEEAVEKVRSAGVAV